MHLEQLRKCSWAIVLASAALVVAGCQTTSEAPAEKPVAMLQIAEAPVEKELAPADFMARPIGSKWTWREEGKDDVTFEIVSADGVLTVFQGTDGCKSTLDADGFTVYRAWENCSGGSGSQEIDRPEKIWPLEVGKSETFTYTGQNSKGHTWSGSRTCEVTGTANVTVPAGTFDTYRVVCSDKGNRYVFHYAPELGSSITVTRNPVGSSKSKAYLRELVTIEAAG